ncbi:hypothetical protein EDB83DRAFT_2640457 [Lactarius deliciosus]|nr:hypothetical protein EDB83DRAFT_2640457 [Lactarius deliciosus]
MRPRRCPTSTRSKTPTLGVHLSTHLLIQLITLTHTSGFKKFAAVGTSHVGSFIVDALFNPANNAPHTTEAFKDKEQTGSPPHGACASPPLNSPTYPRSRPHSAARTSYKENLKDSQLCLKGALHAKLREVGPPVLSVYTATSADTMWTEIVGLDVTTGKVARWRRCDVARRLAYVLSFTPPWRGRRTRPCVSMATARHVPSFIQRNIQGLRGMHWQEARPDRLLDSLRTKLVENPQDFDAYLHLNLGTDGLNGTHQ